MLRGADLAPADLDLMVCDVGPGSFTGLRIGLATVRALAWANGIETVGVGSLEAMLAQASDDRPGAWLLAVLPSRRGVVYAGLGLDGTLKAEAEVSVAELAAWWREHAPEDVAGPEAILGPLSSTASVVEALGDGTEAVAMDGPSPQMVARLGGIAHRQGQRGDGLSLQPRYLAVSEAERKANRASEAG